MTPSDAQPWRQYLCRVCGLIYDEKDGDPDSGLAPGTRFEDIPADWGCPICGVSKADFELHQAAAPCPTPLTRPGAMPASRQVGIVVVGGGRAGWSAVQALREAGCDSPITLVAACAGDVYDKPQLSVALARGLDLGALVRETAAEAAHRFQVRLLAHTHAFAIDVPGRRLRTTRGTLRWQQLILAQGAQPVLPPALRAERVWRVNDLATYRRLRARLDTGRQRVVIVGAGLIGCELANDLALAGHEVTLVDQAERPLALQVPPEATDRLIQAWRSLPLRFVGGVRVLGVEPSLTGSGWAVQLAEGPALLADQVVAATGLRTAGRLALSAGLDFDRQLGGIVVQPGTGRTSRTGIHALGDCVVAAGRAQRFIEPIAGQARIIAADILRQTADLEWPSPSTLSIKTSSLPIVVRGRPGMAGDWQVDETGPGLLRLSQRDAQGAVFATLQARAQGR